eukprot:GHVS01024991.1.p1 GENE.GHVS01024991.1~~GHVS01024991.1.p1  ORF type:complete len:443 (-),score=62.78 GHVS01024991.1:204-1532(-)
MLSVIPNKTLRAVGLVFLQYLVFPLPQTSILWHRFSPISRILCRPASPTSTGRTIFPRPPLFSSSFLLSSFDLLDGGYSGHPRCQSSEVCQRGQQGRAVFAEAVKLSGEERLLQEESGPNGDLLPPSEEATGKLDEGSELTEEYELDEESELAEVPPPASQSESEAEQAAWQFEEPESTEELLTPSEEGKWQLEEESERTQAVQPSEEFEEREGQPQGMEWRSSGNSNAQLVTNLRNNSIIESDEVYNAMAKVDRANYVENSPYKDRPQSIGYNQTISAPHMHAHALEFLRDHLKEGMKALDVGSGSGYLAVCMANMVGVRENKGLVVGIDHIKELVDKSIINVRREDGDLLDNPNHFKLVTGDGWKGVPEFGPYNAIHVGAAADEIPKDLVEQLAAGGKMVVPVGGRLGQTMMEITKDATGGVHTQPMLGVSYVPLIRHTG